MERASLWAASGKFIPINTDNEAWDELAGDAFSVPCPAKTMSRFVHASYREHITVPLRAKFPIPDHMFAGTAPREPSMKRRKFGARTAVVARPLQRSTPSCARSELGLIMIRRTMVAAS